MGPSATITMGAKPKLPRQVPACSYVLLIDGILFFHAHFIASVSVLDPNPAFWSGHVLNLHTVP